MAGIYPTSLSAAFPEKSRIDQAKADLEKAGVKYVLSCWIDILGSAKTKPVPLSEFARLCIGKGPQFAVHSVSMFPELGPADPEWAQNALIADAHFINADWAKNNRPVALKAIKAMYDAIAWWKANPEEGNKIIAEGMKMSVPDVELVIGKDGTGLDSGLDPYTFMQAAQFCGVAPGDPPFGQKNGQMVDHYKLTNSWWVKFGVVKEEYPPEKGIDCSLLKDLYDSGYRG